MDKTLIEDFEYICSKSFDVKIFRNKNILIIGATGFIGGYLTKFFLYLNLLRSNNSKIYITYRDVRKLKLKFNDYELSCIIPIRSNLEAPLDLDSIDYVFHLASIATPKYFNSHPIEVIEPNIFGLNNILKSSFIKSIEKFVYVSTTGVNGFVDDNLRPITESVYGPLDCVDIANCYIESKRMAEMLCMSWFHQKQLPILIVRPSITYGPGIDLEDGRSYADFVKNIINRKDIEIYSDGLAKRNFLYISDFISGLLISVVKGDSGQVFNIASENEISILDLVNYLTNNVFENLDLKVLKKNNIEKNYTRINFTRTSVSVDKIKKLGWSENISLDLGFRKTVLFHTM